MQHTRCFRLLLAASLGLAACVVGPGDDYAAERIALSADDPGDPIDPGDPPLPGFVLLGNGPACENSAVVYLSEGGEPFCTGVLIASDMVLTAAHCLYRGTNTLILPSVVTVGQAANSCGVGEQRVAGAEVNPAFDETADPETDQTVASNDLAVLRLSGPVPGASIATLSATPAAVGASVTHTGYGMHAPPGAGDGQRRCNSGTVTLSEDGLVMMNQGSHGTSFGDSGGPVFLAGTNTVVGTLSFGSAIGTLVGSGSSTAGAGFDPDYVDAAVARLRAGPPAGCTTGETTVCRPSGEACLRNGIYPLQGVCRYGTATCASGVFGACEGFVGPSPEICGNGLDENCDGAADEGCGGGGGGGSGGGWGGGGGGGGFFYPDCDDEGFWWALAEAYGIDAAFATYEFYCGSVAL